MIGLKELLEKLITTTRFLPNWFDPNHSASNVLSERPTSANIIPDSRASVRHFIATSSMTTGKPAADGNILHFSWDNSNRYASQIAILHSNLPPQYRYQTGPGQDDWGDWETMGYIKNREVITAAATTDVAVGTTVNLCSVGIPANSGRWLILSNVYSTDGASRTLMNKLIRSVSAGTIVSHEARVTTTSGQGVTNWALYTSDSTAQTIVLQGYGYSSASKQGGLLVAIRL